DASPDQNRHPVDSIQNPGAEVGHVTGIVADRDHDPRAEVAIPIDTDRGHDDLARDPCRRVGVVIVPLVLVVLTVGVEAVAVLLVQGWWASQTRSNRQSEIVGNSKKKAQKMQLLGISLGSLDAQMHNQPKSVDDFVSYCQQIQRRQDKESRREKGEAVSSDDGGDDRKGESAKESPATFKHPFGVRTTAPSDGIKINIVNATSIPTKSPQERVLDASQLRLVYPVSSGVVHKESTEKWTPVVKDELKTCSDEQKKYVAVTSLEAERYRAATVSC
ncbi:hypothetical protein OSTOST_00953, partial [Ostertagia ostertagi]